MNTFFSVMFVCIIALMICILWVFSKINKRRLKIVGDLDQVTMVPIDSKRRLLIIKRKDIEYVLLVGGQTDICLDRHSIDS